MEHPTSGEICPVTVLVTLLIASLAPCGLEAPLGFDQVLAVLEFELRALHLLGRYSTS
jgi:hypothetical protein